MTPGDEAKSAQERAKEHHDAQEEAAQQMKEFEQGDEVPKDPHDWPDGKAKYITYGLEDDAPYGEGTTAKLGPAEVVHGEDGSITVGGEEVDDPSEFKGEPIKGGVIEQIEKSKQRYSEEGGTTSDDDDDQG
jgi:hypothetical protein